MPAVGVSKEALDIARPCISVYKERMDQWLLAVTSVPAAKGSAKDRHGDCWCWSGSLPFFVPPLCLPCVVPSVVFHSHHHDK